MASITKLSDNKYRLFVSAGRGADGKRIRYSRVVTAKSEDHAAKILKKFQEEVMRDELPLPRNMNFSQLWELYLRDHVKISCKPMTLQWYHECGKRILVAFGHMKVTTIKPTHISNYYAALKDPDTCIGDLKSGVSDETIRHHHRALRAVFNFAVKYKIIKENPIDCINMPKAKKTPRRPFTDEELPIMLDALSEQPLKWQALVMLAITTGMRREELVGLKWSDINVETKTIFICRAVQHTKETGLIVDDTKTESSVRKVVIPNITLSVILHWRNEQHMLLTKRVNKLKEVKVLNRGASSHLLDLYNRLNDFENEYVWNQYDGMPMLPRSVTHWWCKFIKNNNLPHVTFHGTRHTSATIALTEGVDVKSVSSRLGHADASTTLRVYAYALESTDRKIAQLWDDIIKKKTKWHTNGTYSKEPDK